MTPCHGGQSRTHHLPEHEWHPNQRVVLLIKRKPAVHDGFGVVVPFERDGTERSAAERDFDHKVGLARTSCTGFDVNGEELLVGQ